MSKFALLGCLLPSTLLLACATASAGEGPILASESNLQKTAEPALASPPLIHLHLAPGSGGGIKGGVLSIELFPDAAPRAVRSVLDLAGSAHYKSAKINYIWPHIEIGITPQVTETTSIPQEIDAVTLGFDRELIASPGEAMDTWQFELAKADGHWKRHGSRPTQYQDWLDAFESSGSADFLVGVSRQRINEVLGFVYQRTLATRTARRGYVYLETSSPTTATSTLKILLSDRPNLDGRITVIGRIVGGLDLAEQISLQPTAGELLGRHKRTPAAPMEVASVEITVKGGSSALTKTDLARTEDDGAQHDLVTNRSPTSLGLSQ